MNKEEAINLCLKEMFLIVGETYPNKDLTSDHRWYMLRSWTVEQENNFRDWMISFLRKSWRISKRQAIIETSYFLLMYGWTTKPKTMTKGFKNE